MNLLSKGATNAKLAKNSKFGNYDSYILYMAPYNLSGKNLCPYASPGCVSGCLNTAGRGVFNNVAESRLRKARLFATNRQEFYKQLYADLVKVDKTAKKTGRKAVVRLNGTTDLPWVSMPIFDNKTAIELFPDIQFYDYTKNINVVVRLASKPVKNYHVTFSRSETNADDCIKAINLGFNVAIVCRVKPVGSAVIDGDLHDLRFLDAQSSKGYFVALTAKGKAKKDVSGFVL